ncbi:MAG: opacity protein-like surface antigen [Saprospiraceae bacterium]|jgi:opacity protein-like surface antigen
MLKKFCLLFIMIIPFLLQAQYKEIGLIAGTSNYQGDLSPADLSNSLDRTHASFGAFGRYNMNNHVSVKLGITYGTISGDDVDNNYSRNLSFKSDLLDVSITGEFNVLGYQPYALERVFSPYLFAGIGIVHFNPRTQYEGEWVELQPLGTEGQGSSAEFGSKYGLTQVVIPFGGGLKYAINDSWNLGLELGIRKTFTDYLDDVSNRYVDEDLLLQNNGELAVALANRSGEPIPAGRQRGNPDAKDWYIFTGFSVSYNFLDNGLVGSRSRGRKNSGCFDNF